MKTNLQLSISPRSITLFCCARLGEDAMRYQSHPKKNPKNLCNLWLKKAQQHPKRISLGHWAFLVGYGEIKILRYFFCLCLYSRCHFGIIFSFHKSWCGMNIV